CQQGDSNPLTC
nr:immunoglobulin light chain junction region [Macaca mulatta]